MKTREQAIQEAGQILAEITAEMIRDGRWPIAEPDTEQDDGEQQAA